MDRKEILLRMPQRLWKRARIRAAHEDRPTAVLIREAIERYLAEASKTGRAA